MRFTSSTISPLLKKGRGKEDIFGAPALTYIEEKNIERKLGRNLTSYAYSQPMAWGHLMERVVFEMVGLEYDLVSMDSRLHPDDVLGQYWSGTPDLEIKGKLISEIKCYQLKNFAKYTECLMAEDTELMKKDFPAEYWQIVSNCIINKVPIGEAISFMPYRSDLERIRHEIEETNFLERHDFEPWQMRFVVERKFHELPFIEEGGYFKNLNIFRFVVPLEDMELLTSRVQLASQLLIEIPKK